MNAVRGAGKRVFILYLVFALAVAIVIAPRFPALNPGSITAIISRSKAVTIIRVNRSVEIGGGAYFSKLKLEGGSEGNRSLGIPASGPAGIGVNINFGDAFYLGVEGRYRRVKPDFGGVPVRLDGYTAAANIGFRY